MNFELQKDLLYLLFINLKSNSEMVLINPKNLFKSL